MVDLYDGTYIGELVNGKREGKNCTMIYTNGDEYVGDWKNDKKEGVYGKMTYANGDVYEGGWLNNLRSGPLGQMRWANGDFYQGVWLNDVVARPALLLRGINLQPKPKPKPKPKVASFTRFPFSKKSVPNLPSNVIDMENDEWGLSLSGIDGNHNDEPIVFLAGNELFVYTRKRLLNELSDNTSVVYESNPEGRGVKLDVQYFNLRKLFHTLTGDIVPVKYLKNILFSGKQNKKTAVRQRYNSVTYQINSIAANNNMIFSTKKQHIQTLLKDNKLPPTIYQFLPVMIDKEIDGVKIKDTKGKIVKESKTVDRLWSKACADGVPGSYVSGLHGQDMGGMRWNIHTIVEVANHRRKTVKKARSKRMTRSISARSARSAP